MHRSYLIAPEISQLIAAEQAYHYRVIPFRMEEQLLLCKTDQKDADGLLSELRVVLNREVRLEICPSEELQKYLSFNYRQHQQDTLTTLSYSQDFLENLIIRAKGIGSSDIHFEPYESRCRVRFRLDGKLLEQAAITLEEYPAIINKIKIRAHLDISEKRLPQDGRISLGSGAGEFDIRVSTLPTLHGEKLVLRILSKDTSQLSLKNLGFEESDLDMYREGIKKPHGIILISGPTGSGKTTTLYATLKALNSDSRNILTVEDPIEYTLEGINQVQLRENIGLDFASTLRTFLRQDPDIIMVGEIRDVKTANMAIRAALTGHLVLSTIHTNSAWGTISRLIDMGVPAFLIASTLNLSVAQRLVRKLCPDCKKPGDGASALLPKSYSKAQESLEHFIPVGCNQCHHTGYRGRKAIYELLLITPDLRDLIKKNELDISDYRDERLLPTLADNALSLVQSGITSLDEVFPILAEG